MSDPQIRATKRVCYVIPSLEPGGTERQLIYLLRGLARDHELTVICTRGPGAFIGEARRLGAYVYSLEGWGGWDFSLGRRLRHIFRAHRPDIVHTFLFGFELAANRAARETGVPVIVSSRRELADWKKKRHLRIQKRANELTDCMIANSRAVAEFAAKQEDEDVSRYRVIYNGVDADAFRSTVEQETIRACFSIPRDKNVVGMVANFSPVKDHDLFLEMAAVLMRRREDIHFLLVGSGPRQKEILESVSQRNWEDRFTHVTTVDEMADLYRAMTVSVLCSKIEGFPNALMEAMAAERPVVAPAVGGIPELIKDGVTGKLVSERTPVAFADAVEACLERPNECARIVQHAAKYVREEFSVDRMVDAHRALYTHLLANATREGG
ncbi:MAG: glycosyltransferase [Candidatus Hydrogenedentes bacterium]|nr:glycosyltransferase [Candidatus Hydrogenedentota bacterium]